LTEFEKIKVRNFLSYGNNWTTFDLKIKSDCNSLRNVLNQIIEETKEAGFSLVLGSADLGKSTGTLSDAHIVKVSQAADHVMWNYINFGVREHLMAAIANGYLLYSKNSRIWVSTYLAFSDYMRPSIRMAALMNLPSVFIFTHDSVFIGGDGPTHQPVEQLDSLRLIPNICDLRPANELEMRVCLSKAIRESETVVLILSREDVYPNNKFILNSNNINEIELGFYTIDSFGINPTIGLVGSGADLNLLLDSADILRKLNIEFKVISVPSTKWAKINKKVIQEQYVNLKNIIIVESSTGLVLSSLFNFCKVKQVIIENFGYSGTSEQLKKQFGYNTNKIIEEVRRLEV
jgi:transketolase